MVRPRLESIVIFAVLIVVATCQAQTDEDRPDAPDMKELIQAYQEPTYTGSCDVAEKIQKIIENKLEDLNLLCNFENFDKTELNWNNFDDLVCSTQDTDCTPCATLDPIFEALQSTSDRVGDKNDEGASEDAESQKQSVISGEAWVQITRICSGWGAKPIADEKNGTLQLNAGFSEQGIDRVVWGEFHDCQMRIDDRSILIDGEIRLDFGGPLKLKNLSHIHPTIEIVGRYVVDDKETNIDLSLRLDLEDERGLSFIVSVGDSGHVIFFINQNGTGYQTASERCSFVY